jgi:hypothetical protein
VVILEVHTKSFPEAIKPVKYAASPGALMLQVRGQRQRNHEDWPLSPMLSGLRRIAKKFGEYQFGFEEHHELHFRLNTVLRTHRSSVELFSLMQMELAALRFSTTEYMTSIPSDPVIFVGAVLSNKNSILTVAIKPDRLSGLIVIEMLLEPHKPLRQQSQHHKSTSAARRG